MTLEELRAALGWCSVIDLTVLFVWTGVLFLAPGLLHGTHGRLARMSPDELAKFHYVALAAFKIGIILFNLVPYLALRIVR